MSVVFFFKLQFVLRLGEMSTIIPAFLNFAAVVIPLASRSTGRVGLRIEEHTTVFLELLSETGSVFAAG